VVVPRPPERLGPFMSRLFRAQLEEEQKMLMDSDRHRVAGALPPKTPSRATQTPVASPSMGTVPEMAVPESPSTMLMPAAAPRGKPATPPKPSPTAKRPPGAGDTLIDMGAVVRPPAPAADDDVPGATAMLKPGQELPPPPARRAAPRSTDTVPETDAEDPAPPATDGSGRTAFLGTAPRRPAKKPAARASSGGSTNIMTPEESAAAQQEALVKLEEARKGVVHTRTREDKRREMRQEKSGRGMWIALGAGTLLSVALIVVLLFSFFADDSPSGARRAHHETPVEASPVPEAAPQPTPAEERAPRKTQVAPAQEEPAAAPPARHAASGKSLGTLTLNPGPNVQVSYGGNALPRQVGAFSLPVTAESGRIEVGDAATPFRIGLEYAVSAGVFTVKVNSTPKGVASVNGRSVSIAKLDRSAQTVVEVRKPGEDAGMTVRLAFKPN